MRVGIALLRWFPHGGAQRDALMIARACRAAGHEVVFFVRRWDGPAPFPVRRLAVGGWTNHGRVRRFAAALARQRDHDPVDVMLGFERMPGLDAWFAADPCFRERLAREPLLAWTPRGRTYARFERAVAAPSSPTRLLLLDPRQRAVFRRHYETPPERMVDLPPGIAEDRRPGLDADARRRAGRRALGVGEDRLLLMLGSDFRRKGVDRTLRAMAALPPALRSRTRLLVAGADAARPWRRHARRLGLADRVTIEGGRDDVVTLLLAADLLLHPARVENTGTVLVEALAAGLPVLCTGACGHARHVVAAQAGVVLEEPFSQPALDRALAALLASNLSVLRQAARTWAAAADLSGMHAQVVRELEAIEAARR